jgi:glycosyltransferase involved in cell wall biosynthesis
MKISIVNAHVPFVRGGAEYLADGLAEQLRLRGHAVEHLKIPFKWYPPESVSSHMLACRLLHANAGSPDLLIALKFPAYLVGFENKKLWLCHQFRQVYEQWGTDLAGIPDTPEMRGLRAAVHRADNDSLRRTRGVFTIARNVADRLLRFNNIQADKVLYYPLARPELFGPGEHEGYFFYPSRINAAKRQHLAVEAMRHVRSNFRLVLAGKADSESDDAQMRRRTEEWGLQDKVQVLGWLSDEEKARRMSNACAALYLPFDEDAYGYVTLEAMHCHKPVVTLADSGGPLELIEHDRNGLVVEPRPEAIAEAMESLWADRARARELGREANATLRRHRIDWENVLDHLLAA